MIDLSQPWAIRKSAFPILSQASKQKPDMEAGEKKAFWEIFFGPKTKREGLRIIDGVAIIEISGVIFRKDSFFGTSVDDIETQLLESLENDEVKSILLHINSPGGDVDGTPELAEFIIEVRKQKAVFAFISNEGASAAFWIAAAAEKIMIHETAMTGSIGVLAEFFEFETGITTLVSSISPKKVVDLNTDEGKAQLQAHLDVLGEIFVNTIAEFRGVDVQTVLSDFGQGDVVFGKEAVSKGMADSLGNFRLALKMAKGEASKHLDDEDSKDKDAKEDEPKEKSRRDKTESQTRGKKIMAGNAKIKAELVVIDDGELGEGAGEGMPITDITADWVEQNLPEVADELKDRGAEGEQDREEAIDNVETDADFDDLKTAAKKDRRQTAEKLAFAINQKMKENRDLALKARNEDAAKIKSLQLGDSGAEDNEQDAAKAALRKYAKAARAR